MLEQILRGRTIQSPNRKLDVLLPRILRVLALEQPASRHPHVANSRGFEGVVGKQIAAAAAALPPDVAAAAQEQGRARDLEATVEELLTELDA